jgi:diguanylate cyclase (GGDEF)-like protein
MMTTFNHEILERVADSVIFRGVGIESVDYLFEACEVRNIPAAQILLSPGEAGGHLFVVLEGELRVHLGQLDNPAHALVKQGECVGEMSILDGNAVSAYVVATQATTLLVIPEKVCWSLIHSSHGIARNLLHLLSRRMRNDNSTLIESIHKMRDFEAAASMDSLTNMHNRRWMDDAFGRHLSRCQKDGRDLCVMMLDIDHFKRVNDRYGHLAGDQVLCSVARVITQLLRPDDLLARFGGDEFAMLLPGSSAGQALQVAERLRATIATTLIPVDDDGNIITIPVTASLGVAQMHAGDTLEQVLAAADKALYQAKRDGRNRAATFGIDTKNFFKNI